MWVVRERVLEHREDVENDVHSTQIDGRVQITVKFRVGREELQ